ncbi:3073_t:CDS:2, partial [Cetraspora pellucida]
LHSPDLKLCIVYQVCQNYKLQDDLHRSDDPGFLPLLNSNSFDLGQSNFQSVT